MNNSGVDDPFSATDANWHVGLFGRPTTIVFDGEPTMLDNLTQNLSCRALLKVCSAFQSTVTRGQFSCFYAISAEPLIGLQSPSNGATC
jgi:hypothetical protein